MEGVGWNSVPTNPATLDFVVINEPPGLANSSMLAEFRDLHIPVAGTFTANSRLYILRGGERNIFASEGDDGVFFCRILVIWLMVRPFQETARRGLWFNSADMTEILYYTIILYSIYYRIGI